MLLSLNRTDENHKQVGCNERPSDAQHKAGYEWTEKTATMCGRCFRGTSIVPVISVSLGVKIAPMRVTRVCCHSRRCNERPSDAHPTATCPCLVLQSEQAAGIPKLRPSGRRRGRRKGRTQTDDDTDGINRLRAESRMV